MQYLLHLADSDKLPLDVQRYDDRIQKDTIEFTEKLRRAKQTIDTGFNFFWYQFRPLNIAQKMKFSIKDFFSQCGQILRELQIWS